MGDDVAGHKIEDFGTEGKEGVYSGWAVLMQTDFVQVVVCGKAAETAGRLKTRSLVPRVGRRGGGRGEELRGKGRAARGCRGGVGCRRGFHRGDRLWKLCSRDMAVCPWL